MIQTIDNVDFCFPPRTILAASTYYLTKMSSPFKFFLCYLIIFFSLIMVIEPTRGWFFAQEIMVMLGD
ncbi:MAG TPA: hypothetical protein DHV03_05310 [Alphaproteobacteria bacterium]|nr:hypothetical protein [Alphaproteobacteria bacterium]